MSYEVVISCDRCGKTNATEGKHLPVVELRAVTPSLSNSPQRAHYHLCAGCSDAFETWIKAFEATA